MPCNAQHGPGCICHRFVLEYATKRDEAIKERDTVLRLLGEERERCAKLVEDYEDWAWPDKKSEAYREAGDWAGPALHESMKRLADELRKQPEKPNVCSPNQEPHRHAASERHGPNDFKCGECGEFWQMYQSGK